MIDQVIQWITADGRQRSTGIDVTVICGVIKDGCELWTFLVPAHLGSPGSRTVAHLLFVSNKWKCCFIIISNNNHPTLTLFHKDYVISYYWWFSYKYASMNPKETSVANLVQLQQFLLCNQLITILFLKLWIPITCLQNVIRHFRINLTDVQTCSLVH